MSSLPPKPESSQDSPVSGSTPAAVTDFSSYELAVTVERERCAKIAEEFSNKSGLQYGCANAIAAVIRSGK